ncbi:aspartate 1-decarboxylase [Candidatus Aminicenantes bacterium AC-335-B20]|jgi:aspartate 1-decarboxylase|nr:aspartate 1-decarboxylase [SCandidatus Aminicenantes bacterium Aminicenantia_JdfR_composite]MCP2596273.1 aspartate 1-decarboxylase [Candidatus Aminicenantes bacterium AC-335-G13]MCP2597848.1 aspartate 1-decarboxylase [Candidatus Aminicenantes bacterium AC-335-L06]MCP2599058.1 aspartate 1-decarboxylase [Candidatus Aminicenantes bacterium AC-335-B20]MCP2605614.1 aspartate 1-decarboxylase [Candidatus Aminicenantes bacterium AC-335-O07]
MKRIILKSKVHGAIVTDININYEGSLTLDEKIMESANLIPFEQVHVYNITNGERFTTYIIKGEKDSGIVCVNGAAARKVSVGDKLIIASYALIDEDKISSFQPKIVIIEGKNKIKEVKEK